MERLDCKVVRAGKLAHDCKDIVVALAQSTHSDRQTTAKDAAADSQSVEHCRTLRPIVYHYCLPGGWASDLASESL